MIRQAAILLLLATLAGALTAVFHPRAPSYRGGDERSPLAISLPELEGRPGMELLWIDARTAEEFASAHQAGAINLNEDDWDAGFDRLMQRWLPFQTIVVYCNEASCHASEAVAQRLRQDLGTDAVYFLEGGWGALHEDRTDR